MRAQATPVHLDLQRGQGPVAGGVELEGLADEPCLVVVRDEYGEAVAVVAADVAVSEGCVAGPAALVEFLELALADLLGEVRGVELVERREDPFDQLP